MALLLLVLPGCSALAASDARGGASAVVPPADVTRLSAWELFADGPAQIPAADLIPYEVNAPALSDHARKSRFVRVPSGAAIEVGADGEWVFPVGTVIVKSFGFERLVETRLFVHQAEGWTPYVYLWDEDGLDATLRTDGTDVEVVHVDPVTGAESSMTWHVPATTECAGCHAREGALAPIGLRTDQLERGDQLDRWIALGVLAAAPPPVVPLANPRDTTETVERRARAWLHGNCESCHREGGLAEYTGVRLGIDVVDPLELGVGRAPIITGDDMTGGRAWIVSPGAPEESIVMWRLESSAYGVHMPLGSQAIDSEGAELVRSWIAQMHPTSASGG